MAVATSVLTVVVACAGCAAANDDTEPRTPLPNITTSTKNDAVASGSKSQQPPTDRSASGATEPDPGSVAAIPGMRLTSPAAAAAAWPYGRIVRLDPAPPGLSETVLMQYDDDGGAPVRISIWYVAEGTSVSSTGAMDLLAAGGIRLEGSFIATACPDISRRGERIHVAGRDGHFLSFNATSHGLRIGAVSWIDSLDDGCVLWEFNTADRTDDETLALAGRLRAATP